jgi:hypothetical protein
MKILRKVLLTAVALGLSIVLPVGAMDNNPNFTRERQTRSQVNLKGMSGTESQVITTIEELSENAVLAELNRLARGLRDLQQALQNPVQPAQVQNNNQNQIENDDDFDDYFPVDGYRIDPAKVWAALQDAVQPAQVQDNNHNQIQDNNEVIGNDDVPVADDMDAPEIEPIVDQNAQQNNVQPVANNVAAQNNQVNNQEIVIRDNANNVVNHFNPKNMIESANSIIERARNFDALPAQTQQLMRNLVDSSMLREYLKQHDFEDTLSNRFLSLPLYISKLVTKCRALTSTTPTTSTPSTIRVVKEVDYVDLTKGLNNDNNNNPKRVDINAVHIKSEPKTIDINNVQIKSEPGTSLGTINSTQPTTSSTNVTSDDVDMKDVDSSTISMASLSRLKDSLREGLTNVCDKITNVYKGTVSSLRNRLKRKRAESGENGNVFHSDLDKNSYKQVKRSDLKMVIPADNTNDYFCKTIDTNEIVKLDDSGKIYEIKDLKISFDSLENTLNILLDDHNVVAKFPLAVADFVISKDELKNITKISFRCVDGGIEFFNPESIYKNNVIAKFSFYKLEEQGLLELLARSSGKASDVCILAANFMAAHAKEIVSTVSSYFNGETTVSPFAIDCFKAFNYVPSYAFITYEWGKLAHTLYKRYAEKK